MPPFPLVPEYVLEQVHAFMQPSPDGYKSYEHQRGRIRAQELIVIDTFIPFVDKFGLPEHVTDELRAYLETARSQRDTFASFVEAVGILEESLIGPHFLGDYWIDLSMAEKYLLADVLLESKRVPQDCVEEFEELKAQLYITIQLDIELGQDGLGDRAHESGTVDSADVVLLMHMEAEELATALGMRVAEIYQEGGVDVGSIIPSLERPWMTLRVSAPASYVREVRVHGAPPDKEQQEKIERLVSRMHTWQMVLPHALEGVLAEYCESEAMDGEFDSDNEEEEEKEGFDSHEEDEDDVEEPESSDDEESDDDADDDDEDDIAEEPDSDEDEDLDSGVGTEEGSDEEVEKVEDLL
ncbi:hypothetical protein BD626DRAFT_630623 [Schizophyllum amplum]|uniref:Uncharacterized protein n=1 Tax=Schizophyllum amplum TaxID=97359 RepID=A0A550CE05_9AGAR|nr:hypothetical protein BD626DRAFT_630623 [Auriculariopsis ampla]